MSLEERLRMKFAVGGARKMDGEQEQLRLAYSLGRAMGIIGEQVTTETFDWVTLSDFVELMEFVCPKLKDSRVFEQECSLLPDFKRAVEAQDKELMRRTFEGTFASNRMEIGGRTVGRRRERPASDSNIRMALGDMMMLGEELHEGKVKDPTMKATNLDIAIGLIASRFPQVLTPGMVEYLEKHTGEAVRDWPKEWGTKVGGALILEDRRDLEPEYKRLTEHARVGIGPLPPGAVPVAPAKLQRAIAAVTKAFAETTIAEQLLVEEEDFKAAQLVAELQGTIVGALELLEGRAEQYAEEGEAPEPLSEAFSRPGMAQRWQESFRRRMSE